jgi:hypothetical protein
MNANKALAILCLDKEEKRRTEQKLLDKQVNKTYISTCRTFPIVFELIVAFWFLGFLNRNVVRKISIFTDEFKKK